MASGIEVLTSAQFVVNANGDRLAVQLNIEAWESLLHWLKDQEDQGIIQAVAPLLLALHQGNADGSQVLKREEVRDEWDETEVA